MIDLEKLREELYSTRLLVFLEKNPQSNEYHQVLLNANQFKRISLAISSTIGPIELDLSKATFKLPDLQEIHAIRK